MSARMAGVPPAARLAEHAVGYRAGEQPSEPFPEATLTALWLLGRVPATFLPAPVIRPGRAGRGPGPDVREAVFLAASGVPIAGDVEVHLRASDFARHGHERDPAYAGLILHLCWVDDRPPPERGTGTLLPASATGGVRRTVATVALSDGLSPAEVDYLIRLGPAGAPPCSPAQGHLGDDTHDQIREQARDRVRNEGRKRLAEMTWRACRLADRYGFPEAFRMLLERAVASSAGRVREDSLRRTLLVEAIISGLGDHPLSTMRSLVLAAPSPAAHARRTLIGAMRVPPSDDRPVLGAARASEVAWNAVLPLLASLAAAYDDIPLAAAVTGLAETWPAPRPYGRTRALDAMITPATTTPTTTAATEDGVPGRGDTHRGGALYAQGLLHLQDLWCSRGWCGVCPLST